jgi:hypothetical protein
LGAKLLGRGALLARQTGEVDLTLVRGKWYLAIVCDMPDPDKVGIGDILGVDLGVVNLPLTATAVRIPAAGLKGFDRDMPWSWPAATTRHHSRETASEETQPKVPLSKANQPQAFPC